MAYKHSALKRTTKEAKKYPMNTLRVAFQFLLAVSMETPQLDSEGQQKDNKKWLLRSLCGKPK